MIARCAAALFAVVVFGVGFSVLPGCGNGGASEPPVTSYDPAATSKLQFAVGVATTISQSGNVAYGLNVVETLRQKDGLSGTLYNVPMIFGPSSFDVLTSTQTGTTVLGAGYDLGTNHITWGTLNQSMWIPATQFPKKATTGAFGYGLCPCNSDAGPGNGVSPLYQAYNLPIYGDTNQLWFGGPPAFPAQGPTVLGLGWLGYSLGFTDFTVAPVIGTYHFYAAVPPAYNTPQNPTPSPGPNGTPTPPPGILTGGAQLTRLTPLPAFTPAVFTPDNKGGGHVTFTVPAGAIEGLVEVVASGVGGSTTCGRTHANPTYYTVVAHHPGAHTITLPDDLGPLAQSGGKTPTLCRQENYALYAVGADYPLYEASYPQNLSQLPLIRGKGGQADITTSASVLGVNP